MEFPNYKLPVDPSSDTMQDLENELGNYGQEDDGSNDYDNDYDNDDDIINYKIDDNNSMNVEKQEETNTTNINNNNNQNYTFIMTAQSQTRQATTIVAKATGETTEEAEVSTSNVNNTTTTTTTIANDVNNNYDDDDDESFHYKNSAAAFFGADVDSVWNSKRRKKKQKARLGKTAGMVLPPEVQDPLNKGLLLFYSGDYDSAIPFLKTVILRAPKLPDPYQTLGMICEYRGDKQLALQYYIRTASYTKLGFSHYRKFISVAMEVEDYKTAHFGLTYLIKHQPDENIYKQKIVLYVITNDIKNSLNMIRRFFVEYPGQYDALMDFADACKLNDMKYMKFALEGYLTYCLLYLDHKKLLKVTKDFCTHDMLGKPKKRRWKRKARAITHINNFNNNQNNSDEDSDDSDDDNDNDEGRDMNIENEKEPEKEQDKPPLRWDFACLFYACSQAADILMSSHSPFPAEESCDIAMNLMHTLIDVVKQYNEHQKYLQAKKKKEQQNESTSIDVADPSTPQLAVTPPVSLLYGLNNLRKSVLKKEKRYELTGLQVLVPVMQKLKDQDGRIKAAFEASIVNYSDDDGDGGDEKEGGDDHVNGEKKNDDNADADAKKDTMIEAEGGTEASALDNLETDAAALTKVETTVNVNADVKDEEENDSNSKTNDTDATDVHAVDTRDDDEEEDSDAIDPEELSIAKHQAKFLLRIRLNAIDMLFKLGKKTQAARMLVEIMKNHVEFYCDDDMVPTRLKLDEEESVIIGLFSKKEKNDFYEEIEDNFYKFSLNEVLWNKILWHLLSYDQDQPKYLYRCCILAHTYFPNQLNDIKNYMNLHILNLLTCITCTPAELHARDESPDQTVAISANALKNISFNCETLFYEVNTIIEFAKLVYHEDKVSFISMIFPILEAWSGLGVYISKRKVELRHMNDVNRMMNFANKHYLNETQNALWRMVRVLCAFVPVVSPIISNEEGQHLTKLVYQIITTTNGTGDEQVIDTDLPYARAAYDMVLHIKKKGLFSDIQMISYSKEYNGKKKTNKIQSNESVSSAAPIASIVPAIVPAPLPATAPVPAPLFVPSYSHLDSQIMQSYDEPSEPSTKRRRSKNSRRGEVMAEDNGHRTMVDIRDIVDSILPRSEAVAAAMMIKNDPFSIAASNTLTKSFLRESEIRPPNSILMEQALPVTQYRRQEPQSLPFTLMSAHVQNIDRRHAEALQVYFESFCLDPSQPLNSLCLAKQLIFLSKHWLVLNRHETFVKAMACAVRYQRDRLAKFKIELLSAVDVELIDVNEASIKQEILYNLARLFNEVNVPNLSIGLYYKVLDLHDQIPKSKFNLTAEAAYNLMIIFKKSGAKELALEIMKKYLTF